jgi:hypothetical protein
MKTILRGLRPSPALVIACLALFVAMGGVGYAALKLKPNSVRTKNIRDAAVTAPKLADGSVATAKLGDGAVTTSKLAPGTAVAQADNANRLGGMPPTAYQGSCRPGAIAGSLLVDTTGLVQGDPYKTVPGFSCTGGAVQIRKTATGTYNVRFVGNPAAATAIANGIDKSGSNAFQAIALPTTDPTVGNEKVFSVENFIQTFGPRFDDHRFNLIAFDANG